MTIRQWARLYGPLTAAVTLYLIFAPIALVAVPLAGLLVLSPPRSLREALIAAVAGGFGLAWLARSGSLPDQLLRSGTVIAATVFVVSARYTTTAVTHRALLAVATASAAAGGILLALGSSWAELHWWVAHRVSYFVSQAMGLFWQSGGAKSSPGGPTAAELATWADSSVRLMADYYPAILALAVMGGLGVATAIYHRVAVRPLGTAVGRFREFRFSEHLGWVAVVPLIIVLIPRFAAGRLSAINLLVVTGTLYALRGVAVIVFALQLLGGASGLVTVLLALAAILLLPIAAGGAILLGVVDAGFDLRRRWTTPPVST
ncbi:MAG: DUF2232 domain-containing protein [Gemmatimonadales bacterium]